jgi:hypothetical protein
MILHCIIFSHRVYSGDSEGSKANNTHRGKEEWKDHTDCGGGGRGVTGKLQGPGDERKVEERGRLEHREDTYEYESGTGEEKNLPGQSIV